jgi:hypothetical protein
LKKTGFIGLYLIIILFVLFYFLLYPKLEIVSGYNAKIMCSCVFVSGLYEEEAKTIDLGFGPLWLASNRVNYENQTVRTSVLGMHPKAAIFREGLGCSLINDRNKPDETLREITVSDKSDWPQTPVRGNDQLASVLQKAFDESGEKQLNTRAVLVLKDGKIAGEAYAEGISPETPLLGWSMTKSLTAAMAGVLAAEGFWSLDSKLPIEAWQEDARNEITLRHTLNMATGLEWTEDYGTVSPATTMLYSSNNM